MAKQHTDTVILLPTYNERSNLQALVNEILGIVPVHVCIIDDNSPDGTGELADEMALTDPRIHVLHRSRKEGLGKAYVAGFQFALNQGFERIVQMDADYSHSPCALPHLIQRTHRYDIAIGSRWVPGGGNKHWPWFRRALSRSGSFYARNILSLPVSDATSGYKCIRRKVLESLPLEDLQSSGYVFQIDLLHRALKAGFSVTETPITFVERSSGTSKMSNRILIEAILRVPLLRLLGSDS